MKIALYVLLVVIVIYLFSVLVLPVLSDLNENSLGCELQREIYAANIKYKVRRKFIDAKGNEVFIYTDTKNKEGNWIAKTKLFDLISVGDSILKRPGSYKYKIMNNNSLVGTFQYPKSCQDSIK